MTPGREIVTGGVRHLIELGGGGKMIPFLALALLAGSAIVAVLLMLAARRFSPQGQFHDSVPGAAVFGVLGVAFAVILAFVMFLGFESYVRANEGASREAVAVSQLARVSRLFPVAQGEELRGGLGCYARAVISDEWPLMSQGRESDVVLGWLAQIETTIDEMPIDDGVSQIALGHWLDEHAVRREGRRARLAESAPTIPAAVWSMLVLGAVLTVAYVIVFADRRERWWTQAVMVGSITALIVSGMLVINFLDHPYEVDGAYIAPHEMETSARLIVDEVAGAGAQLPCDAEGRPA
jgi:hypothetical protein